MCKFTKGITKYIMLVMVLFIISTIYLCKTVNPVEAAVQSPSPIKSKQTVKIGTNRIRTFSNKIACYAKKTIWITVDQAMENEELSVKSPKSGIVKLKLGDLSKNNKAALTIQPKKSGKVTIVISSNMTNDKLYLDVTVISKPKQKKKLSAKEVYAECGPGTVKIESTIPNSGDLQGSGFFIAKNILVTNYHVIEGANKIVVTTYNNKKYEVKNILGYDKALDLALLKINANGKSLSISKAGVFVGEKIYVLGSPLGLTGTMSDGIVSTASRIISDVKYIQITASISQGNSGGPLINQNGEVIGINTMCYVNGQNLNFAIDIKQLQKINTNKPITVAKYYKLYTSEIDAYMKKLMENKITEDSLVSQKTDTCQVIPSETCVDGKLQPSETGDYYRFTVKEAGNFLGFITSNNKNDLKNTYFELINKDGKLIEICTENEDKLYQSIEAYLKPGEYYVLAYLSKDYNGSEVPYNIIYLMED